MKNHINFYIEMSKKDNNILKSNYGEKSLKFQYAKYADAESLLENIDTCYNIPEKTSKLNQTDIMHGIIQYLRIVRLIAIE